MLVIVIIGERNDICYDGDLLIDEIEIKYRVEIMKGVKRELINIKIFKHKTNLKKAYGNVFGCSQFFLLSIRSYKMSVTYVKNYKSYLMI